MSFIFEMLYRHLYHLCDTFTINFRDLYKPPHAVNSDNTRYIGLLWAAILILVRVRACAFAFVFVSMLVGWSVGWLVAIKSVKKIGVEL